MTDKDRLDWLNEHVWFMMPDSGLPGRWSIDFADYTGRNEGSGSFDLREAIDACMNAKEVLINGE